MRTTVKVTWTDAHGERRVLQKETRQFTAKTPARVVKQWKDFWKRKLEQRVPVATDRGGRAGTLFAEALRYYPLIKHLADWVTRRSEVRAWLPKLGATPTHAITRTDVLEQRGAWKQAGVAHRTINNRISALRDLYHKLYGDETPTPCDGVPFLKPPRVPIQRVSAETINKVLGQLLVNALTPTGGRPRKHAEQDRARLMVMVATGRRPCEIERAQRHDVSLEQCSWGVRDAKGGWSEGLYLNSEMLIAWQAFIDADAWGPFPDHFARRLREAGWPAGIRPYNARHGTWIDASERGADLADIQAGAGHRHIQTTREHYVPVLNSRMQKLSELIDHRFGWTAVK